MPFSIGHRIRAVLCIWALHLSRNLSGKSSHDKGMQHAANQVLRIRWSFGCLCPRADSPHLWTAKISRHRHSRYLRICSWRIHISTQTHQLIDTIGKRTRMVSVHRTKDRVILSLFPRYSNGLSLHSSRRTQATLLQSPQQWILTTRSRSFLETGERSKQHKIGTGRRTGREALSSHPQSWWKREVCRWTSFQHMKLLNDLNRWSDDYNKTSSCEHSTYTLCGSISIWVTCLRCRQKKPLLRISSFFPTTQC